MEKCPHKCSLCEELDHHWMEDCDEETGEPQMVCKHCDAVREYRDSDDVGPTTPHKLETT
jgi:hypothetical protein